MSIDKSTETEEQSQLAEIRAELNRLAADDVKVSLDDKFEPEVGTLLKVEIGSAYWHLYPAEFTTRIQGLPDGSGPDAVKQTIESDAVHVWHGPAPEPIRATSP